MYLGNIQFTKIIFSPRLHNKQFVFQPIKFLVIPFSNGGWQKLFTTRSAGRRKQRDRHKK